MSLLSRTWCLVKKVFRQWAKHDDAFMAAAIAFYAVLSLSPLLMVMVAAAALWVEPSAAERYIVETAHKAAGTQAANLVREMLIHTQRPAAGASAATLGIVLMLFGASRLFQQLKRALNGVWEVQNKTLSVRAILLDHLLAVLLVLLVVVALLIWLGVDIALSAIATRVAHQPRLWRWVSFLAGWALLTLLFAATYHLLPNAPVRWRHVWAGACVGALLFALCKLAVGIYLGFTGVHSAYGAASAAVALLLWAYFSAQAFLFGAEWVKASQG